MIDRLRTATGVRVIGDVHGAYDDFRAAVAGAEAKGLFVVQVGDLVDRGPDSPACIALALDLVERGEGVVLLGNHDDKLARALKGHAVDRTGHLALTLDQLARRPDRDALVGRFLEWYQQAPYWMRMGPSHVAVHGAFEPRMIDLAGPAGLPSRTRKKLMWLSLYGEVAGTIDENGLPLRSYGWVNDIPAGFTVLVGHDVRSTESPLTMTGDKGGRAVFLDTGSGKGGRLSWVDVSWAQLFGE